MSDVEALVGADALDATDRMILGKGLSEFYAKYTSEDDASFRELMLTEEQRRRDKLWWLWDQEAKGQLRAKQREEMDAIKGAIAAGEPVSREKKVLALQDRPNSVDYVGYTARNGLMSIPEGCDILLPTPLIVDYSLLYDDSFSCAQGKDFRG